MTTDASSARVIATDLFSQVPRRTWWQRATQVAPVRIFIGLFFVVPGAFVEQLAGATTSIGIRVATGVASVLVYLGTVAAFARLIKRRRARELSPGGALGETLLGMGGGILLLAATVALLA